MVDQGDSGMKIISCFLMVVLVIGFAVSPAYARTTDAIYKWYSTQGPGIEISGTGYPPSSDLAYSHSSERVYATTYNPDYSNRGGVWYYDGSWHDTNTLQGYEVVDLATNPNTSDVYAVTGKNGVWKYNGSSWSSLGVPSESSSLYCAVVDPDTNTLYVGGTGSGVNVFYYNGSWHSLNNGMWWGYMGVVDLVWDNVNKRLYSSIGSYIFYYTNAEWHDTNWIQTGQAQVGCMTYDSNRNLLWVGGYDSLFYYDGSWHKSTDSSGQYLPAATSLAYDTSTKRLYASLGNTVESNLWYYDGSWKKICDGGWPVMAVDDKKGHIFGGSGQSNWCEDSAVWVCKDIEVGSESNWYFAEGTTRTDYEEWVLIQNPTNEESQTCLLLMTPTKAYVTNLVILEPNSRTTIRINDLLSNEDVSVQVCSSNPDIVCERAIYWDNKMEGHDSIGITQPSNTWYLAEGCTAYGYQTWACLQNPSDKSVQVYVTYNTDTGPITKPPFTMQPYSRHTIDVKLDVGEKNVSTKVESSSPIVAERAMYWGFNNNPKRGGHCSIGTSTPSSTWYLAEGSTLYGFDEWVLVQNPNTSPVTVDVTYMTPNGATQKPPFQIPAQSRYSIHVNADIASDVSTKVTSRERPIIAERAMYWDKGQNLWSGGKPGTDTIGVPSAKNEICFAEGCTSYDFEEWLCLMNPNLTPANISVTYIKTDGVQTSSIVIPPNSRTTVDVNNSLNPYMGDVSIKVTSSTPIMAERAMYWGKYFSSDFDSRHLWYEKRTGGHVSIGYSK